MWILIGPQEMPVIVNVVAIICHISSILFRIIAQEEILELRMSNSQL